MVLLFFLLMMFDMVVMFVIGFFGVFIDGFIGVFLVVDGIVCVDGFCGVVFDLLNRGCVCKLMFE